MKTQWQICIADDEYLARELLKEFLRPFPEFCVAWECETGQEAADVIRNHNPDLVFLDIQMPELPGLEVLEVTGRQHGVIFTTAYDQHALKAFDLHAVDYLLKPFSRERFETALNKARQQAAAQDNPPLKQLVSQHQQQAQRILLRERGQTIAIPFEELLYAEAQDDYVVLNVVNRHKDQAMDIEFLLADKQFSGNVQVSEVNGPDIKTENDFGKSDVKTVAKTMPGSGRTLRYRAAPHSFTMLKAKLA